jgi:hypothetical protein
MVNVVGAWLRRLQPLRCFLRRLFASFSPGFWSDLLNLPVGHGGQTAQNVAEIGVGLHTIAAATLNDRVDNRTAFSRVGVSEKEPVLFPESRRSNASVRQTQVYDVA